MVKKNKNGVFSCLGASSHSHKKRAEDDFYATDPKAAEILLQVEPDLNNIWECACGEGHLAKVFADAERLACATDIVDRGYVYQGFNGFNFFDAKLPWGGDIVTNPPYSKAKEFVKKALELVNNDRKVCMFLRIQFLESKQRWELFKDNPPIRIWVFTNRMKCARNGEFDDKWSSAQCYAWFVWQKGYKGYPTVRWID